MSRVRLLAAGLFLAGGLLWAQFYAGMDGEMRNGLAEDYYLVGSQYKAVGMDSKGQEFQDLAYALDPGLQPGTIADPEPVSISEYLATADVKVLGPPGSDGTYGLIRSPFLRLTGALIMEDPVSVLQNIDGSVYLTDLGLDLTAHSVYEELTGLFGQVSLRGLPPSRVYDLSSLKITRLPEIQTGSWGTTYTADITSKMDLSGNVSIWTPEQRFYLRKSASGRWLIFAVGERLPPARWSPVDASDNTASIREEPTLAQTRIDIEKSFLTCIEQFLARSSAAASDHLAQSVLLERMNVVVTRDEIGATFQGYFEESDFGGLTVQELVDPDSVFVASTDKYEGLVEGERYLLTVKTRLDLSSTIPFWTRFQEYYFALENDAWKIFAIF